MKHLVTMAEQKGCHGGETKMVPRQHSGPGNSWRYRCKRRRADVRNMLEMVGCSRLPGVPPDSGMETRNVHETNGHGANISYISYMQGHLIAVVSGYTFEAFKRDGSHSERCRGSRRSRDVVGSSCSRGDGSRSSGTRRRR